MKCKIFLVVKSGNICKCTRKLKLIANNNNFIFGHASKLLNTDTVRPGGDEKTIRSSHLPPPNRLLSNTLSKDGYKLESSPGLYKALERKQVENRREYNNSKSITTSGPSKGGAAGAPHQGP